ANKDRYIPAKMHSASAQQASESAKRTVAEAFSQSPVAVRIGGSNIVLNPSELSRAAREAEAGHRSERESAKRSACSVSPIPEARPAAAAEHAAEVERGGVVKAKDAAPPTGRKPTRSSRH